MFHELSAFDVVEYWFPEIVTDTVEPGVCVHPHNRLVK